MTEITIQAAVLLRILRAMQSIGFYNCDTEIWVSDDDRSVTLTKICYKSGKDQDRNVKLRTVMVVQLTDDLAAMEIDLFRNFEDDYDTITFPYSDPEFPNNLVAAIDAAAANWKD